MTNVQCNKIWTSTKKYHEIFVVILNLIKIGSYSVLRSPQHLTEPH